MSRRRRKPSARVTRTIVFPDCHVPYHDQLAFDTALAARAERDWELGFGTVDQDIQVVTGRRRGR